MVRRWGRYVTANCALLAAMVVQIAGAGLVIPVMVACGLFLGVAGQTIKLCADSAMQIDVDDALRGHVFAVQDALFWVAFIISITIAAVFVPADGYAPAFALCAAGLYFVGFVVHSIVGRRGQSTTAITRR